jgi:hypothetical protein
MNEAALKALDISPQSSARDRTIDITTTGARTGAARRIETWFYRAGDEIYLTGQPAPRGWYANLLATPQFTFHLKNGVEADLPAVAVPVTDDAQRRSIFTEILDGFAAPGNPTGMAREAGALEAWLAGSPLMRVDFS